MKKILLLITFVFGLSYSAFAGACVSGDTLADYITAGSCTYGGLTFSGFGYVPSGSVLITSSEVTVTPETAGGEVGFQLNAPWFAFPTSTLDSFISFTASCDADCKLNDWLLAIGGVSLPPASDAFVSIGETSPQVNNGLSGLSVGCSIGACTLSDSGTFAPVGSVSVSKDLIVYGGSVAGTSGIIAHVSSITELFSYNRTTMTPEPSLIILCAAFLGLLPVVRRKMRCV